LKSDISDVNSHTTIPVVSFFTSEKSRAFDLSALFYCRTVVRTGDEEFDESKCLFELLFSLCLAFRVSVSTQIISEMTQILTVCVRWIEILFAHADGEDDSFAN
jgi:hypothetical protein